MGRLFATVLLTLALPAWASVANLNGVLDGWFYPLWDEFEDVQYGISEEEKADLYLQHGAGNPAVIFIHGGGWSAGDKSGYSGYYAEKYLRAGYSVISINYRLARTEDPNSQWPAQLQDVQLALRWIREHAEQLRIDPDRICAFGDSAGGHLALFLGALRDSRPGDRSSIFPAQSPQVRCVVNMFGPADLTHPKFVDVFKNPPLFGGRSYAEAPELWRDASPLESIESDMAPTLVIQGLRDDIVDVDISNNLVERLTEKGVTHEYITFDGGHWFQGLNPPSLKSKIDNQALDFVRLVLGH